jgi:putative transposon-encoded protein
MSDATLKGIPKERVEKAIHKTVGPHTTCGAIYLSKDYVGRKVIVVILKGGEEVAEKNEGR